MEGSDRAEAISRTALGNGLTVGVAESLTGGLLSSLIAKAPEAGQWFKGGVVAYSPSVKQGLLGVSPGPVVTARCAQEMATGAARVLDADVVVSVTGVGGPDPEEGHPPGTVWFGVRTDDGVRSVWGHFDGDPATVCHLAANEALGLLLDALCGVSSGTA
jgi:nicotinamide-nucleotide amidase